jgi:hypothetical protein
VHGNEVVVTLGRLAAGSHQTISIDTAVSPDGHEDPWAVAFAVVTSSTTMPLFSNPVVTKVHHQ